MGTDENALVAVSSRRWASAKAAWSREVTTRFREVGEAKARVTRSRTGKERYITAA